MQSHNGDVELSVTLSTKGVKSDIQKIKDEISSEVKRNGLSLHPQISEKELEKELKQLNDSSDNTIELTPEIDANKLSKIEKLFKNVIDIKNEGNTTDNWDSVTDGIVEYLQAYEQLSNTEKFVHNSWLDDNYKLINSNKKVSDSITALSDKQLLEYYKQRKAPMFSENSIEKALAESLPLVSPKIDVSEDKMNQALVDSNPVVEPDVNISEDIMEQAIVESNPVVTPKVIVTEDIMNEALIKSDPVVRPKVSFENTDAVNKAVDDMLHSSFEDIIEGREGGNSILSKEDVVDNDAIIAVNYLEDLIDKLIDRQQEMLNTSKQNGEEWVKIENEINNVSDLMNKIKQEGSQAIPDFVNKAIQDRVNRTQEALKQSQQKMLESISPAEDVEATQRAFNRLIEKIYNVDTALKDGKALAQEFAFDLQKFDEGFRYSDNFVDISNTFNSLKNQFSSVVSKMHEIELLGEEDSDQYRKMAERASKLADAISAVKDDMLSMRNSGIAYSTGSDSNEYAKVEKQYNTLAQRLSLVQHEQKQIEQSTKKTSKELYNQTKVVQVLSNSIRNVLSVGLSNLSKLFMHLAGAVQGTHRQISTFGLNFKQILGYTLGIQGLYSLFGKLRGAISQGIGSLAQWGEASDDANESSSSLSSAIEGLGEVWGEVSEGEGSSALSSAIEGLGEVWENSSNRANDSISTLNSSLAHMQNAWGAAFEPILTFVTPVLDILIEKVAEVANAISYMLAKLTGQSTWYKAIRVQEDYADSLSGTGNSASEAEQKLASYDKLVMVNKNTAGGASASNADVDNMFEEMSIDDVDDWVSDLLKKIEESWENADFTDLGNIAGIWIKKALDMIPWKEIQGVVKRIAQSIATLLNGFFETEGLGTSLGKTIAEALKTAFIFVDSFVHTLHWDSIGRFIADALLAVFEDDKLFKEAGKAVGGTVRGFIDLIWGALDEFVKNDGFEKIGQDIANFINTVLDELNAVDEKSGLTGWEKFGQSLSMSVQGLLDTLSTALGEADWESLGRGIAQVLENIDWLSIIDSLNAVVTNLLSAIAKAITGVTDEGVKGALATAIALVIAGLVISVDSVTLLIIAADVILGFNIGKVIGDALTGGEDSQWYKEFNFTQLILDMFGVGDKDELETKLSTELWDSIVTAFNNVTGAIWEYLNDWSIGALILKVLTLPMTLALAVWLTVINVLKTLIEGFVLLLENANDKGFELGTKAGIWVQEKVADIAFWITDLWESYIVPFSDNLTAFILSIPDSVKTMANDVIGFVEGLLNKIISGLNALFDSIGTIDIEVPDWATKIGLGDLSFDLPSLKQVSLPRLAQGAIIPPNKEFMAILGDQKQGTNIETPLETMMEAFRAVLAESGNANNEPIVLQLNGKVIAQAVWDEERKKYKQTGSYAY